MGSTVVKVPFIEDLGWIGAGYSIAGEGGGGWSIINKYTCVQLHRDKGRRRKEIKHIITCTSK